MKKKLTALVLTAVMIFMLIPAMSFTVLAADKTVSINGLSSAGRLNAVIGDALRSAGSGDTVTVTGTAVTDFTVEINIPDGVKLVWKAALSSTYVAAPGMIYSGLIQVRGAGIFEVADGADLSMYSPSSGNIAINVFESSAKINIIGGKVAAYSNSGHACHTIGSSKSTVDLTVGGNAVLIARSYGTGTPNVIDLEDSVGNVTISGNARLEATAEDNADNATAIAYTIGNARGDISVTGGEIVVTSRSGNATGIYTQAGNISVSGGSISVTTSGGNGTSTDALRLGDNNFEGKITPAAGSVRVSGGRISVVNSSAGGNAFGIGMYDHDDTVTFSGGTMSVASNGANGGSYGIYFHSSAPTHIRGTATMTGGSISSSAPAGHAYGIRLANGTASVSGGSISTSSNLPGWAAYIEARGAAAFLNGSYSGSLIVGRAATGMMMTVDSAIIPAGNRGKPTGITVTASNGITSAGAVWDATAVSDSSPYIACTGAGAEGLPKVQFGNYTGSANAGNREAVAAFVTRLYKNVLGRDPHQTEVDTWTNRLLSGEYTGSGVAHGFFFSKEFTDKKVSNEEYIDILYTTLMGREADAPGKAVHLSSLNSGRTREWLFTHFANSPEFDGICKSYGIQK